MIKHNIANVISISRFPCAVFFFLIIEFHRYEYLTTLFILFFWIEISDYLDGFIARKLGTVSDLGKILDPGIDVSSHFLCILAFHNKKLIPSLIIIVFVLREYWVLFVRSQIIMKHGLVMSARLGGKIKTALYAISIFLVLFYFPSGKNAVQLLRMRVTIDFFWYLATATSIFSAMQYYFYARSVITQSKKTSGSSTDS